MWNFYICASVGILIKEHNFITNVSEDLVSFLFIKADIRRLWRNASALGARHKNRFFKQHVFAKQKKKHEGVREVIEAYVNVTKGG